MDTQRPELHWFPFHDEVEDIDIMQPCAEAEPDQEATANFENSEICHV